MIRTPWGILLCVVALALAGCADARIGKLNRAAEQLAREQARAAAEAGDREGQFRVGMALCCAPEAGKDTRAATDWLCRSAVQGYPPAARKLGQIYSGRIAEGVALASEVTDPRTRDEAPAPRRLPLAYTWIKVAEGQGSAEGAEDARRLWASMSELQRTRARALMESDRPLPCRWDEALLQ